MEFRIPPISSTMEQISHSLTCRKLLPSLPEMEISHVVTSIAYRPINIPPIAFWASCGGGNPLLELPLRTILTPPLVEVPTAPRKAVSKSPTLMDKELMRQLFKLFGGVPLKSGENSPMKKTLWMAAICFLKRKIPGEKVRVHGVVGYLQWTVPCVNKIGDDITTTLAWTSYL